MCVHMKPPQVLAFVLSMMTAACGDKKPSSAVEAPETIAAQAVTVGCPGSQDCGECVAGLREWMRTLVDEGHEEAGWTWPQFTPVQLPATQRTRSLPQAPLLVVGKQKVVFESREVADTSRLANDETVSDESPHWKVPALYDALTSAGTPREVVLQVDSTVPWKAVRRVAATVDASGVDSIVFAFLKPTEVARPGPSSIDGRISELDESNTLSGSDQPIRNHPAQQAYGACAAAYEGLLIASTAGQAAVGQWLVDALPDAIAGCGCNVEVEAVKALHWWQSGRRNRKDGAIYVGVRVPLAGGKKRSPISVADTTPWSSANKELLEAVVKGDAFFFSHLGDKDTAALSKSREPRKSESPGEAGDGRPASASFASLTGTSPAREWSPVRIGKGTVTGDLDEQIVRRYIQRKLPAIANCYENQLKQTPGWTGAFAVNFQISSTGDFLSVSAEGAKLEAECVERAIRSTRFPTPKERTPTTARFSFELGPMEHVNND